MKHSSGTEWVRGIKDVLKREESKKRVLFEKGNKYPLQTTSENLQ